MTHKAKKVKASYRMWRIIIFHHGDIVKHCVLQCKYNLLPLRQVDISDTRTHHCFSSFLFRSQTVNLSAVMQHPPHSLIPLLSKPFQCDSVFFMLHLGITAREHPSHSLIYSLPHSLTIGQALGSPALSFPHHIPFQILWKATSRTHFIWHHFLWTCHFTSLLFSKGCSFVTQET